MRKRKPKIAAMRHRVVLCSQKDVVTTDGDYRLNRTAVDELWAEIVESAASEFSVHGAAVGSREKRTHKIRVRYRTDLEISNMAWIYERRLKSSPRWFKILRTTQTEQSGSPFWIFEVRLVERSDDVAIPTEQKSNASPARDLPVGVEL